MTAALVFLVGVGVGAGLDLLWKLIYDLYEIHREQ